ncbi:MAG: hypothetical protein NTU74_05915 [Deltaproteobacteria bacterium]|nr:hypothetical protein [Deltaproteobacteria bacterium]
MSERNSRDTFRDKRGTEAERGSDEDYYPEDAYSPWKKSNMEGFMSNLSKSSGLLLVIVGAGVFILIRKSLNWPFRRTNWIRYRQESIDWGHPQRNGWT